MTLETDFADFRRDFPYREVPDLRRRWRYRAGGDPDGPAVLVLAGATAVPDPLFLLIRDLGRDFRVFAPAYPAADRVEDLVDGVLGVLDAEGLGPVHVVGSSFGGYLAQCLAIEHPDRVDRLVLAQTGVRHFAPPLTMTVLRLLLRPLPERVTKAVVWRTWRVLLADLGADRPFWTALLRGILDDELTKDRLLGLLAVMADFTVHHRPVPGRTPSGGQVLILAAEHDRAFARQAAEMRAVYPAATVHTMAGAGHGALFTHTREYLEQVHDFLREGVVQRPRSATSDAPQTDCRTHA